MPLKVEVQVAHSVASLLRDRAHILRAHEVVSGLAHQRHDPVPPRRLFQVGVVGQQQLVHPAVRYGRGRVHYAAVVAVSLAALYAFHVVNLQPSSRLDHLQHAGRLDAHVVIVGAVFAAANSRRAHKLAVTRPVLRACGEQPRGIRGHAALVVIFVSVPKLLLQVVRAKRVDGGILAGVVAFLVEEVLVEFRNQRHRLVVVNSRNGRGRQETRQHGKHRRNGRLAQRNQSCSHIIWFFETKVFKIFGIYQ